ncbi:LAMI_0C09692g1_1 [Lachancea mirantina]|uniref:LAMI_0C09692g1_1 n=1 Tax=Lachancea mirantina TaxID=1230905 RepID=A0A1G4J5D0_9SACH|nr:LAMI_0C09692g1_1 [Lachancea mirantina]
MVPILASPERINGCSGEENGSWKFCTTPRTQLIINTDRCTPPLRYRSKMRTRPPYEGADTQESPCKPSNVQWHRNILPSPEWTSDEDTCSDLSMGDASGDGSLTSPLSDCGADSDNKVCSKGGNKLPFVALPPPLIGDLALRPLQNVPALGSPTILRKSSILRNKRQCIRARKQHFQLRSILKKPTSDAALNLIVSSASGSIVDATLYATEMNAAGSQVPLPSFVWEKVTIPVDLKVREESKLKRARHCVYYDDSDDLNDLVLSEDAAVIRAYEFRREQGDLGMVSTHSMSAIKKNKHLRWASDASL